MVPRNPRVKNQKYCSSRSCKNARKRLLDRRTSQTPKGKSSFQTRNKRWRNTHPPHANQKEYRDKHPAYVKRNRELQKERNKKRQKNPAPMIVKTDEFV